jgi:tetratricopeptide (TPR) repeat protein
LNLGRLVATQGQRRKPRIVFHLPWGHIVRFAIPLLAAGGLFAILAGPPAFAQSGANAEICAAADDSAFSPQQRIAACSALIAGAKDDSKALVDALVKRAGVYFYLNRMPAAFADLDRAIALDPKSAAAYRLRGESFRVINRIDRALADANEAIRLDPESARGYDNRANAFLSNKQYDRAIADYNEAIRRDPKYAVSYMDRGAAYYFKGDYQNAIKDYDESIKLDPKRAQTYTNRAAAYKKLGRVDQAIADDSTAIKMMPDNPEFFDNRGLSYEANGDFDRAIADFNEAIRLKPQANFITNRGDSYNQKGELDRAIADYDRAIQLNPNFYLAFNNRGVTYMQKGDLDRAIADFEQALRINPRLDSAAAGLADARTQRDRRASISGQNSLLPTFDCGSAKRAVEKAICSDPELARLDRQVDDAYRAALGRLKPAAARRLKREQREFIARRNKQFGRPEYQFKRELEVRLAKLRKLGG